MNRRRRWAAGIASGVLLGVVVLVVAFDWNWLKGPVESVFSDIFGRNFEIHGDLDAEFALAPRIVMDNVTVDNADWGSGPHMLEAERFAFVVDLWQLVFDDRLDVTDIHFERPDVLVEQSGDGELNWQSAFAGEEEVGPPPQIGTFTAQGGQITYRGPEAERAVRIALEQLDGRGGNATAPVTLHATGSMIERPLTLNIKAGSLTEFEAGESPYPVDVALEIGETSIALAGSITDPAQFQAAELNLDIGSPDLAPLLTALDLPAEPTPPISFQGRLVHERDVWALMDLNALVGESDLSGRAGVDLAKQPMLVKADLQSERLQVEPLRALVTSLTRGEDPAADDTEPGAKPPVIENNQINLAFLPNVTADLRFDARHVEMQAVSLQDLHIDARLVDQIPKLTATASGSIEEGPLALDVRIGSSTALKGDARPYPIEASVEVGQNKTSIRGTVGEPLALAGLDVRFDVASPRPATLFDLLNLPAPDISGLELSGHVVRDDHVFHLRDLAARVGESDIGGSLSLDLSGKEPRIQADLASDRVVLGDLESLFGPKGTAALEDVQADLPVEVAPEEADHAKPMVTLAGFNPEALPAVDAHIQYTLGRFEAPDVSLQNVRFRGQLADRLPVLELTGDGQLEGEAGTFDIRLGALDNQTTNGEPYPFDVLVEVEQTTIDIAGRLQQPPTFEAFDARFDISSEQPNKWLALTDLDAPQLPPILASGQLARNGEQWRFSDLYLEAGESNLAGSGSVDLAGERPKIVADLESDRLITEDFLAQDDEESAERDGAAITGGAVNFEALPQVDADVSLDAAYLVFRDMRFEPLTLDLQLRDRVAVVDLSAEGRYHDSPLTLEAHLGSEESLRDPDARYPVQVELVSDDTEARASGTVGKPVAFTDLNVDVVLKGPDLDRIGEILQLSLPETPPFDLQSNLAHEGDRWRFTGLGGTIGDSDVRGDVTLEFGGERPMIRADLASEQLDFDDLGVLVGVPPATGPDETASEEQEREAAERGAMRGVLPDEPFDVPELRMVDAEISFVGKQVEATVLPIQRMELELTLEDGLLNLAPLRFGLADGELESEINLSASENALRGEFDLVVRQIRMNQLLSHFDLDIAEIEMEKAGVGTFSGQAQLDVEGKSVQELAASANGEVVAAMDGGRINAMIVEGLGLDLGEVLALLMADDEDEQDTMVPIQCFVSRFDVNQGVMKAEALVLETNDSRITGAGEIDLGNERLDLRFVAHPRDPSVLTASTPVQVEGSFENPEIDVVSEELRNKVLSALGLGVILPVVGAIIPFIETGDEESGSPCAALLDAVEEAQAEGPPGPDAQ